MPSVPCPNLPPSSAVGRSPLSRASSDNAALLLPTQFVQGWAARTTAGVSYNVAGGAKILVGGEVGGLGSQNFTTWSVRGRASVPF